MPDTSKEVITARVAGIVDQAGERDGIESVEVELLGGGKARMLRIYIDKPGGVTHADCEMISHQVSEALDQEDLIPGGSYTLEVSSPGVERKLKKPRDFERSVGQKAKIVLKEPVENQLLWEGLVTGFAGGVITLEPTPGKQIQFPLAQVNKANLKFEW